MYREIYPNGMTDTEIARAVRAVAVQARDNTINPSVTIIDTHSLNNVRETMVGHSIDNIVEMDKESIFQFVSELNDRLRQQFGVAPVTNSSQETPK